MYLIPFQDLKRHHRALETEIQDAFERVAKSGNFILGEEVAKFEEEFACFIGTKHAIAVASGTDALELALRALGVGPGDRVLLAANAGFYGTTAVLAVGGVPEFLDVDFERLTLDPSVLSLALNQPAKAIIVTHLYGQMADMAQIQKIAAVMGIPVIEDCAQAHGASLHGTLAGSWGTLGCFSFYPTKNLGALGDAGMVVTSDASLAERVQQLRQYGWKRKYEAEVPGGRNSRMDEFQAAVLRLKLPRLIEWNARRKAVAERYNRAFEKFDLRLPQINGNSYVAHLYVIRSAMRSALKNHLENAGIQTQIHYPVPDHRQPFMPQNFKNAVHLGITEIAASEVLSLPCFPELEDNEADGVIAAICEALRKV